MVVLDASIVNIALPSAQRDLGFSTADRQWVITAYSLAFGGLLLLGGRLADLYGRKRMFLIGLAGFAAASAVGGAANGIGLLIAARGLQGAFGAVLAPASLSLLTTTFTDRRERNRAFAVFGSLAGAGGAIGLLLGGVLTQYLSWRWCLYVNVGLAVLALIGGWTLLQDQASRPGARLDVPGALTVVTGLVAIVYGMSEAQTRGWLDPVTLGLIVGGVILLGIFVLIEQRVSQPLLPLRVVLDRDRSASYVAIAVLAIGTFATFLFFTYFFQQTLGYTPVRTGLAFLPLIIGIVVGSQFSGPVLLPRLGPRWPVTGGMLGAAAGLLLATRIHVGGGYVSLALPALLVFGLGAGTVFGCAINTATTGAAPSDAGVASAMVNTCQQVGGAVGIALLNTLAASATVAALAGSTAPSRDLVNRAAVSGDVRAFLIAGVIVLLGAAVVCVDYRPGVLPATPDIADSGT